MEDDGSLFFEDGFLDDVFFLEDERDELEDLEFDIRYFLQEVEDDMGLGYSSLVKELDIDVDKLKKKIVEDRMQVFYL